VLKGESSRMSRTQASCSSTRIWLFINAVRSFGALVCHTVFPSGRAESSPQLLLSRQVKQASRFAANVQNN
jgi:hypothetical protein